MVTRICFWDRQSGKTQFIKDELIKQQKSPDGCGIVISSTENNRIAYNHVTSAEDNTFAVTKLNLSTLRGGRTLGLFTHIFVDEANDLGWSFEQLLREIAPFSPVSLTLASTNRIQCIINPIKSTAVPLMITALEYQARNLYKEQVDVVPTPFPKLEIGDTVYLKTNNKDLKFTLLDQLTAEMLNLVVQPNYVESIERNTTIWSKKS